MHFQKWLEMSSLQKKMGRVRFWVSRAFSWSKVGRWNLGVVAAHRALMVRMSIIRAPLVWDVGLAKAFALGS